jgi:hypothetical protein
MNMQEKSSHTFFCRSREEMQRSAFFVDLRRRAVHKRYIDGTSVTYLMPRGDKTVFVNMLLAGLPETTG